MEDLNHTPRTPKFKHSRELVRIALGDGMTQVEIARLCRTQQSIVSAWAAGRSKAREDQIKPLLTRYGHRLNRSTSRLYLVQGQPEVPWEETEVGRLVGRLTNDPKGYSKEVMSKEEWDELVIRHVKRRLKPQFIATESAQNERPADRMRRMMAAEGGPPYVAATEDAPRGEKGTLAEEAFELINSEDLDSAEARVDWGASPAVSKCWCRLGEALASAHAGEISMCLQQEHLRRAERLVRVEGAPIWRHVLGSPRTVTRREGRQGERFEVLLDPIERWVVHPTGVAPIMKRYHWLHEGCGRDD